MPRETRTRGGSATRRELLASLVAVAASWAGPSPAGGERSTPIGVQLYTVRSLLEKDFDGTLAALAAIGYREVELAGYHGRTPPAVRAALERAGLLAPSAHVAIEAVRDSLPRVLDEAHLLGHRFIVVAWIPEAQRSLDGYRGAAELFNRVGERARAA